MKQKTIKKECVFSGVGLHTGNDVQMKCLPADENSGINFIRVDLPGQPKIKVDSLNICIDTSMPRCTAIGKGKETIYTVEHFMSVLGGLSISNLHVEVNANELPGLDGSGIEFLNVILKAGISSLKAEKKIYDINEPIGVAQNGSSIYIVPSKDFIKE